MIASSFYQTIDYIVNTSIQLKNKYIDQVNVLIEFACIFSKNMEEYQELTEIIKQLGRIVQDTPSGYTYMLDNPIKTKAGKLRLIKIRKPDPNRSERGDVDFNTNYPEFKNKYADKEDFELITREDFEMLRLSNPEFDVLACFSSTPLSKSLGVRL